MPVVLKKRSSIKDLDGGTLFYMEDYAGRNMLCQKVRLITGEFEDRWCYVNLDCAELYPQGPKEKTVVLLCDFVNASIKMAFGYDKMLFTDLAKGDFYLPADSDMMCTSCTTRRISMKIYDAQSRKYVYFTLGRPLALAAPENGDKKCIKIAVTNIVVRSTSMIGWKTVPRIES